MKNEKINALILFRFVCTCLSISVMGCILKKGQLFVTLLQIGYGRAILWKSNTIVCWLISADHLLKICPCGVKFVSRVQLLVYLPFSAGKSGRAVKADFVLFHETGLYCFMHRSEWDIRDGKSTLWAKRPKIPLVLCSAKRNIHCSIMQNSKIWKWI